MTENEAVERIKSGICNEIGTARYCHDNCMHGVEHCAYSMAIQAIEEIQSYRAIGTVEHIQLTFELCKGLDCLVKMYEAIGTIEEFKALKEKAEPKKIVYQVGKNGLKHEKCPTCGSFHVFGRYCSECGQKLDWGNE